MKDIFIEPNDVLIFRDGRSFSAGDDHLACGIFPPSPTNFYGAFRSALLSQHNASFSGNSFQTDESIASLVGSPEELGTLCIEHFSLARRSDKGLELLFPIPNDLLVTRGAETSNSTAARHSAKFMRLTANQFGSAFKANVPLDGMLLGWALHNETDRLEYKPGFLDHNTFQRYLHGELPTNLVPAREVFEKENRTGIALQKGTKTAETGKLYAVEFVRMNRNVGFAVRLNTDAELADSGLLRLGGEAKSAYYAMAAIPKLSAERIKAMISETQSFRLVLVTPAVFTKGWLPDCIDSDGSGQLGDCRVQLIGAAISRYQTVGGWDMMKNKPKQSWRAVPAGSVYFFKLLDGDVSSLFEFVFGKSICQDESWRKQGLGITYIGGLNHV
ncbi:MAG: type III-B CRISPR module-associated protein Cmr3 [Candidatus Kryptoniota bacterium]